uniref:Uncharacterized protein n=1 Tax=Solanum lycopersicum TaxID=4081 RepID=A0A3Q7II28_SOLLC
MDFQKLNAWPERDHFPMPFMDQMLDKLARKGVGNNQISIELEDQEKTTFTCPYGTFAFKRMPFGLCDASTTFQRCMMSILFDMALKKATVKNKYLVPLVHDLMDWLSKACWFTKLDLRAGYWQLRKYTIYVKMKKCEFAQQEIKFLGHLVSKNQVRMDPKKVQTIVDWQEPRHVRDLRSFLGLANYYTKFIAGYSKRAAALTYLLKKDTKWNLKNAIASKPILKLPDFELPFEVHTDASDKAIGSVLVQKGHPVAFESRKLNDAEQIYSTHEKEMVVVVYTVC